ncbi:fluoride efflux transporter CrcB [Pseudomonas matsuisoli]|uniref:Fluoride-specific ion channel FluC n=1 Tax=Pseudomonas matsuisoli TaxID=1515666 RepID=A0A917PMM2_9PSED|nr:fluoride efflux transporter CrcB [Pseudomonas matsuisoli]GGJ84470.1 putative fluoride ion transporter CrcB [Pseudomonas matsuisoli]
MIAMIAAVAAGGALGTLLRFATSHLVNAHWPQHFYTATLAVNIVGCLLIGYVYGIFMLRPEIPLIVRSAMMVGFLGGLTTFSSFSLDTLRLLETGQLPLAMLYAGTSVVGGLLATWIGLSLTKL